MNKPMTVGAYVIVALLSGFGLYQAGDAGVTFWKDLTFLHQARLADEYRQVQQQQKQAEAAAKAATKPPLVEAVP